MFDHAGLTPGARATPATAAVRRDAIAVPRKPPEILRLFLCPVRANPG